MINFCQQPTSFGAHFRKKYVCFQFIDFMVPYLYETIALKNNKFPVLWSQ